MRLFVAAFPEETFCKAVESLVLSAKLPGRVTLVKPKDYHLTLYFLGEIAEEKLPQIEEYLRQISLNFSPINLRVHDLSLLKTGWGQFGVVTFRKSEKLSKLHREIHLSLSPFSAPKVEQGEFLPHLSIFRAKDPNSIKIIQDKAQNFLAGLRDFGFPIHVIYLVQSDPGPSGSSYNILRPFPLVTIV